MWRQILARILGPLPKSLPVGNVARASVHGMDRGPELQPKPWRTVGLTEQRLREKNRRSWRTSAKGWSDVLGRISR